jgi:hypothetical protein
VFSLKIGSFHAKYQSHASCAVVKSDVLERVNNLTLPLPAASAQLYPFAVLVSTCHAVHVPVGSNGLVLEIT